VIPHVDTGTKGHFEDHSACAGVVLKPTIASRTGPFLANEPRFTISIGHQASTCNQSAWHILGG
jgi:hypothetical protein